jgi:CheY-like chemotaxis protein
MPGVDGAEATRRLRRLEETSGSQPTPIVAVTANALESDRKSCLAAGFDAYLAKPFEFADLAEAVERLCARRPAARAVIRAS